MRRFFKFFYPPLLVDDDTPGVGEISPGVIRPSYALAGMVAGAIIAKPDRVKKRKCSLTSDVEKFLGSLKPRGCIAGSYGGLSSKWEGTVGGKSVGVGVHKQYDNYGGWLAKHLYVEFEGETYDGFILEDEQLIYEAMVRAAEVARERENAKKEAEKQQKALDIIEKVFSTPEPEPETHYEYAEPNGDCDSGCDCCQKPVKRPVPGCEFSCCKPS